MSARRAFVSLLTSDAYLPGALTVVAALNDVHHLSAEYETVCLVTPETVDVSSIKLLRKAFDVVVGVEVIVPPDTESLDLLGRPDLDSALTKLHVFRLSQYSKVIFLDADVLPLRPLSHLFDIDHEFSAVPDVGWPDIFNSGVMVLSPGEEKFKQLQELLVTKGSWDGADQGLLNEWRGNNWNRLSFTYNTTPTAIYTYAPAYQRFGSQISLVHFIGPHKPWHSIAFRAPGSTQTNMSADTPLETPSGHSRVYDYSSLVDRWYSVYDRHYRSHTTPEAPFQPTRQMFTWNGQGHPIVPAALGLEELRRIALEGMAASGLWASRIHGEGVYRTMPLEGRFDLMRPRTRAERKLSQMAEDRTETPASPPVTAENDSTIPEPSTPLGQTGSLPPGSPVRWTTLPTPGINELPPAPLTRPISLPPTPLRYVPAPYKPLRMTREAGAQTVQPQQQVSEVGLSVPPVMSPSAVETLPGVTPAPPDTYFPKMWDLDRSWSSASPSSTETSLTTMEPSPFKSQLTTDALFSPSSIPAMLRDQGQYRNTIRDESDSLAPDVKQMKRVFPWEECPRHIPVRVFPDEGSPLITSRRSLVPATPERKVNFRSPMPSPLIGFPPIFQPHYSFDGPSPQKHTGGVRWSLPSSSPLSFESELDRVETSSQDGDIEDEVDSEEETVMRSRRSSVDATKRSPKYRSIGVQTDPRELREEAVQVTTLIPVTEAIGKPVRRYWPIFGGLIGSGAGTASPTSPTPDSPCSLLPSNFRDKNTSTGEAGDRIVSPVGDSLPSPIRKGTRVWDPARGVETFKKGSEEVLSRFMKIGSREEHA